MDACPTRRSECWRAPQASACSSTASIPLRDAPVESSAPHLTRLSSARLFTTWGSTRSQKSQSETKGSGAGLPWPRASMIARDRVLAHVLHGVRPKRILPSTTAKSAAETLTSGGSTSMPISSHAAT